MERPCRYTCSGHAAIERSNAAAMPLNMQRPCRYTCSGHAAIHAAAMPLYMQRQCRYGTNDKGHINKRVCMDMVGGHGRVGVFLHRARPASMHPKVSCTRPRVSSDTQYPSSSSTQSSNFSRTAKPRLRHRRRHMSLALRRAWIRVCSFVYPML